MATIGWGSLYPGNNFTPGAACAMLGFSIFFYYFLFLYFDAVFPNEYGTQKHWLFCLRWIWKKNKQA